MPNPPYGSTLYCNWSNFNQKGEGKLLQALGASSDSTPLALLANLLYSRESAVLGKYRCSYANIRWNSRKGKLKLIKKIKGGPL